METSNQWTVVSSDEIRAPCVDEVTAQRTRVRDCNEFLAGDRGEVGADSLDKVERPLI